MTDNVRLYFINWAWADGIVYVIEVSSDKFELRMVEHSICFRLPNITFPSSSYYNQTPVNRTYVHWTVLIVLCGWKFKVNKTKQWSKCQVNDNLTILKTKLRLLCWLHKMASIYSNEQNCNNLYTKLFVLIILCVYGSVSISDLLSLKLHTLVMKNLLQGYLTIWIIWFNCNVHCYWVVAAQSYNHGISTTKV